MKKNNQMSTTTLASYALLKALTDSKEYKNQYEILAEFIRYIIVQKKLREFLLIDIQNALQEEFTFAIPQAAIKTSIKQIKECKKSGEHYYVENNAFNANDFSRLQIAVSNVNQGIVDRLIEFADKKGQRIKKELLEDAFIKYLIDDSLSTKTEYSEIISRYLIANQSDLGFQKTISEIREGSILYCGLAYNMTDLGSIRDDLTLFLDTEVLFNIAGYNGTIYQKLTEDLLNQVKSANAGHQRIKLRFFQEVKQEIDGFFKSAEYTISGKGELIQNTAMSSIINGCESISDVRTKQADFYYNLRTLYGIIQDEKKGYYTEADYSYNIETIPDGFEQDEKSYEAIRFISHINKLRKGSRDDDYTRCKYLLVTETRRIQEIANKIQEETHLCAHALPTSVITNIIWFKLGCGFTNKEYPTNVDASYKARGIISGILSNSVSKAFEKVKKEYKEGKLSKEQVADRIVVFREKIQTPDGITADNIDELLDFTPDAIDRYEQGIKANIIQIEEQQQIIAQLEAEKKADKGEFAKLECDFTQATEENKQKNVIIQGKEEQIETQKKTIQDQESEITQLREEKRIREEKKQKWKKRCKFVLYLFISAIVFSVVVLIVAEIMKSIAPELYDSIKMLVDAAGIIGFIVTCMTYVRKKAYGEKKEVGKTNHSGL